MIKEEIEKIYNKNTNYSEPEQAINQAESLKSLSTDLYTDAKRFIYELLQNADDAAIDGNTLDVTIKLINDTLILAHSGKAFSARDVQGLCSINNGTKKSDTSKTGFKGIGFKSVFGQSNKVTIFSNNEYFKFDVNHNFGWKEKWGSDKGKWEEENDREFLYPWQIIPIYLENNDLCSQVQEFLTNAKWNVATIIDVLKKEEIEKAIEELSSNVNMFLFLKNINSIKFDINTSTKIIKIDRNENELVLKKDNTIVAKWLMNTIRLSVPSELKDILQEDANVPKKLKEADNIELTLAIKKGEQGLEKLSNNDNLLYAYLPTDEKRYSLPILVNSTFLTSANRESLHTDSKWNQWLFRETSINLFKWIAKLVKGEYSSQAYSLIPSELNLYDDLSNAYDDGIKEAIKSIPFIFSKENELLKVNEAVIDETTLSEKVFIGSEIIKKFIENKIGDENNIANQPFVFSHTKLKNIGVENFSWNDIPAFFAFNDFKSEHTVENNIKLIEYFKNESEISNSTFPKEKLKSWAFLYDHKRKLNYLNKICFPKIDDDKWNHKDSDLDYINETLYNLTIQNTSLKLWLQKLGVEEKTDITYLNTVIIPNARTYCTDENHAKTIKYIYDLYSNEDIKNDKLEQLSDLNLLTTKGSLISASECYLSDNYNPKLKIESILDDDIFLSEKYLSLDEEKEEVKRFFKLLKVQEDISIIKIEDKTSRTELIEKFNSSYFVHSLNTYGMSTSHYKNIISLKYLSKTKIFKFSKPFWVNTIENLTVKTLKEDARGYWGHSGMSGQSNGDKIENYISWYIKNKKCLPTTKGECKNSTKVFLNTEDIKQMVGKYLPVFDGVELNQDWKSFFKFKTELKLEDYLKLLTNIMDDENNEKKIKSDNKKRIQLILNKLLELSINWGTDEIDKVKNWALSACFANEEDNIVLCKELKYYADGDNSIFHNIHNFISLNEENKSHQNLDTFLGYLGVEILRQSSFSIEIEGERVASDLKYKLETVLPFLKKWIQKIDKEFDVKLLDEKINTIHIDEASRLSLSYNGTILKSVQIHLEADNLLVTTPWGSNKSMIELPKVLCGYFNIKGYEDKLIFLLKADDESEIREYFEAEKIELPIEVTSSETEEAHTKEEARSLNITEKEYDDISNNFKHISLSSIKKREYIQSLLPRAKKRIIEHLSTLDEYNCDNIDNSALTVLSGITKNGNDIYIIPRPSDNGKVILYYPSELDTLEYADSELWYEDGKSKPKRLTFGKLLRDTKINKIPIIRSKKEKIIEIIKNPQNEEVSFEAILPSSFDIAKVMASLANTNGGYFIIGYSDEDGIVGISSEFRVDKLTKKAIQYSNYFDKLIFEEITINGKTILVIKVEKSNEDILIDNKKYIRVGSIIEEELENNNKPIIFTEGKTDWKHLKKALVRFQEAGKYKDLDIEFKEYEDMNMGDAELDRMVQTYCKNEQSKKHIFIFDRDNKTYVKKYAKDKFNNHENNVYSFCIPKINDALDAICIEWYYKEDDLKTTDKEGKRIFLGKEFLRNGNSLCGKYVTEKRNTKSLDILDSDKKVYLKEDNEWSNNIALSKNDFTNNVINDVDGFDDFYFENFKLIFDVIDGIVKEDSQ